MNQRLLLLLIFCLAVEHIRAQPATPSPGIDHSYKPMSIKLSEDGSKYIRFILWHQFWVRYTENNPGTVDVNGELQSESFDIGLRRSRLLAMAQVSPRFLILTHFGINNQTFINGGADGSGNNISSGNKKPGIFIHDAWVQYTVIPEKLYLGSGLHYWNGISRMTNASTLNFMTLDAPIFNWPNIELTDQFARQFGIFAKGQLGRFDYRAALNKPFVFGRAAAEDRAINRTTDKLAFTSYVNYQFLDKESNTLPYMVGTYLGSKHLLNIGTGFYHHPESTHSLENGQEKLHDMNLLGLDLMYERPLAKGAVLSFYSAFYNYDFGPNYLRNVGIMNTGQTPSPESPAAELLSFNGAGNAQPTIGTGTIAYAQLGYGLPQLANGARFMPYVTFTRKNFELLEESSNQLDLGLNYFINSHHAKITLQYGRRPIYNQALQLTDHAGELILQTHIFL